MRKLSLLLIGLLMLPMLILTSCDRGDDPVVNSTPAFTLLKEEVLKKDIDLDKILNGFVLAPANETEVSSYYIMDIRSATDFANGRIAGAKNVPFANILTDAVNAGTKPILVVCYTGQTATYATTLLRMYGYPTTKALKWGMSGWNSTFAASWNNAIANPAQGHSNWTSAAAPANMTFTDPVISSTLTTGDAILKARIESVVAAGFTPATVKATDVLNTPNNYFINNYFSATDYSGFGHINGAYRIQPLTLAANNHLNINPASNAKVVTYCYTGQTSAAITAWLRVLGYDAYTLTFGMNALYNANPAWSSNKWSSSVPKSFSTIQ